MAPLVSVIIPAFNTEAYIEQAVRSVLAQTVSQIEVIVVDDGSSDNTVGTVRRIQDERIRILENENNLGVGAARNRALSKAEGQWVAVLDSDDWYAPDRLQRLLDLARDLGADMVADDLYLIEDGQSKPWSTLIGDSGRVLETPQWVDSVFYVSTDVYGARDLHLGFSKPVFKRSFLLEHGLQYDERIKVTQDYWLYLSCLLKGARFVISPDALYYYRSRPGSLVDGSQVERLAQDIKTTKEYLCLSEVSKNPALVGALKSNLRQYRRYSAYFNVVEPLKERRYGKAIIETLRHPYSLVHMAKNIMGMAVK